MLLSNTHTIETSEYKKNNWKALIGMRLNSNWSIEGQYTNFAKDLFMNTSIAADGTKTTKEDALSGKSFGVTGLCFYLFKNQTTG
jgi:hypothetical protein